MSSRKVIARFDSVFEAQAIQSILESYGIEATVDNGHIGSILPHQTQSMGGVSVSVWEKDEAEARKVFTEAQAEMIGGPEAADPTLKPESEDAPRDYPSTAFNLHMKKAVGGAIIGSMILPVASTIYAIVHLRKAYLINSRHFWDRKFSIVFSLIFSFAISAGILAIFLSPAQS